MRLEKDQWRTVLIAGGMVLLFVGVVWYPDRRERARIDERTEAAYTELGIGNDTSQAVGQWHTRVVKLRAEKDAFEAYVPQQNEMAQVLHGLTQGLRANGIEEQEVETGKPTAYAKYTATPLMLEFEAPFPVAYAALRRVEKLPRLMRIDGFSLEHASDGTHADCDDVCHGVLRVRLDLQAFHTTNQGEAG